MLLVGVGVAYVVGCFVYVDCVTAIVVSRTCVGGYAVGHIRVCVCAFVRYTITYTAQPTP